MSLSPRNRTFTRNRMCNVPLSPVTVHVTTVQDASITSDNSVPIEKNNKQLNSLMNFSDMETDVDDSDYCPSEISNTSPLCLYTIGTPPSSPEEEHPPINIVQNTKEQEVLNAHVTKIQDACITSDDSVQIEKENEQLKLLMDFSDVETGVDDSVKDPDYCPSEISDISPSYGTPQSSPVEGHHQINIVQNTKEQEVLNGINQLEMLEIEQTIKQKKNLREVFCFFCESSVTNFPRHLFRNHSMEFDVQKFLALPALSNDRKILLSNLRKKGNYLISSSNIKPVRKNENNNKYLPCSYCFGFYTAKHLWRHRKRCTENTGAENSGNAQSSGQNLMLRHIQTNPRLREMVFPRMRADHISLAAKKDPIICAFASRYLSIHKEPHFIPVTSRKMRELAKLLIEVKKIQPSIKDLYGALKGVHYDTLVAATKTVAKYDEINQQFAAPTYALQMGTTLKQCCDIAIMHALKKLKMGSTLELANDEVELKNLIQLIEGHWKFDISSQASNDINLKKWNKVTVVPLASDLKLLKDFLINKANNSLLKLNENPQDEVEYVTLLETIYCRILLLNRKRPGELQRLLVNTYKSTLTQNNTQGYEEFTEVISEAEKMIIKNFKRIVIRGKRGRGVPVLFSNDVQEHLSVILKIRECINQKTNIYLFGHPKTGEPIIGYKVLKKYAVACGASNPEALTCTRLRKHLATLTQLFNMIWSSWLVLWDTP